MGDMMLYEGDVRSAIDFAYHKYGYETALDLDIEFNFIVENRTGADQQESMARLIEKARTGYN